MAKFKSPKKLIKTIRTGKLSLGDRVAILGCFYPEGTMGYEVGNGVLLHDYAVVTITSDGLILGSMEPRQICQRIIAWCPLSQHKPGHEGVYMPSAKPKKSWKDATHQDILDALAAQEIAATECRQRVAVWVLDTTTIAEDGSAVFGELVCPAPSHFTVAEDFVFIFEDEDADSAYATCVSVVKAGDIVIVARGDGYEAMDQQQFTDYLTALVASRKQQDGKK